jgi:hypothetical protein
MVAQKKNQLKFSYSLGEQMGRADKKLLHLVQIH